MLKRTDPAARAALTTSWLDVLSRLRTRQYGRFTGFSFAKAQQIR